MFQQNLESAKIAFDSNLKLAIHDQIKLKLDQTSRIEKTAFLVKNRMHFIEIEYFKRRNKPISYIVLIENFRQFDNVFNFEEKFKIGKKQIVMNREFLEKVDRRNDYFQFDFISLESDWLKKTMSELQYPLFSKIIKSFNMDIYENGFYFDVENSRFSSYVLNNLKNQQINFYFLSKINKAIETLIEAIFKLILKIVVKSKNWEDFAYQQSELHVHIEVTDSNKMLQDKKQLVFTYNDLPFPDSSNFDFHLNLVDEQFVNVKIQIYFYHKNVKDEKDCLTSLVFTVFKDDFMKSYSAMPSCKNGSDFVILIEDRLQDKNKNDVPAQNILMQRMLFYKSLIKK